MSKTAEELKDTLNDIERDVYDGVDCGDMFTKAYVLADELGESIDKLREENADLRELMGDLYGEYRYLRIRHHRMYLQHEERMRAIESRMRELGIEVDG